MAKTCEKILSLEDYIGTFLVVQWLQTVLPLQTA